MKIGKSNTTKNFYCPAEFSEAYLKNAYEVVPDFTDDDYDAMIARINSVANEYGLTFYDTIGLIGSVDTEIEEDEYKEMIERMHEARCNA